MYVLKPLLDDELWHDFLTQHPQGNFCQSTEWAAFKNSQRWHVFRCGIFEKEINTLVAGTTIFQYSFKNNTAFLHLAGGPLLEYDNPAAAEKQWKLLRDFLLTVTKKQPTLTFTHIRIEPQLGILPSFFQGFSRSPIDALPRHTRVIDLTQTEEELLNAIEPKTRYNIRLAEKKGVVVKEEKLTPENIALFYALYEETCTRQEIHCVPLTVFLSLQKTCGERMYGLFAYHEETLLAAAILLHYGTEITYLYAASSDEKRNVMAPSLVQWKAIQSAKLHGALRYDLYGVLPDSYGKKHPWYFMSVFKRKFGGVQKEYAGAHDLVLDLKAYSS